MRRNKLNGHMSLLAKGVVRLPTQRDIQAHCLHLCTGSAVAGQAEAEAAAGETRDSKPQPVPGTEAAAEGQPGQEKEQGSRAHLQHR